MFYCSHPLSPDTKSRLLCLKGGLGGLNRQQWSSLPFLHSAEATLMCFGWRWWESAEGLSPDEGHSVTGTAVVLPAVWGFWEVVGVEDRGKEFGG